MRVCIAGVWIGRCRVGVGSVARQTKDVRQTGETKLFLYFVSQVVACSGR